MGLTAEDLSWVRTYVPWDPPDDAALSSTFDLLWGDMVQRPTYRPAPFQRDDIVRVRISVAEWHVRARLSSMIDDPGSYSYDGGDISENWSSNISALRERLRELQTIGASDATGGIGRVVRDGDGFRGPDLSSTYPTSLRRY